MARARSASSRRSCATRAEPAPEAPGRLAPALAAQAGAWPPPPCSCSSSPRAVVAPLDRAPRPAGGEHPPPAGAAGVDGGRQRRAPAGHRPGRARSARRASIYGGRVSLVVGVAAVLISATIGVLLGLAAGYFGGRIDWTIMTLVNVMLTFPVRAPGAGGHRGARAEPRQHDPRARRGGLADLRAGRAGRDAGHPRARVRAGRPRARHEPRAASSSARSSRTSCRRSW